MPHGQLLLLYLFQVLNLLCTSKYLHIVILIVFKRLIYYIK
ncbi:hypothetical protein LEP1GSC055_1445 [Leptospira borgpetersenii str. Brem 307]|uniref:Lipoprotein n=1 Tax=Leptospira borgpetersenii str. Brem 328 TaxID=1049780 RepID=A0ABC9SKH6_LEPBO|nr:hypothetical protein LEP1GSC055_1445 [Leptospira borgpetersenii str. Brem 307]EMN18186.1 hypothetical protein LEP1GSC056_1580 [Leptospira borgpetersenii str. Brem 328]